jgi:hypothetical protein
MAPIEGAYVIDVFVNAVARTPANGLIELSGFQSRHDSAVATKPSAVFGMMREFTELANENVSP